MDVMMEMWSLAAWRNEKSRLWKWRFKRITQTHKGEQKKNYFFLYPISHEEQAADILQHNNLNPKDFNGNRKMWLSRRTLERSPSFFCFFASAFPLKPTSIPPVHASTSMVPSTTSMVGHLPAMSISWSHVQGKRGPHLSQVLPSSSNAMRNP